MSLREKILSLKDSGMSQADIARELECTSGTVSYHCNENVKAKALEKKKLRDASKPKTLKPDHPLLSKELPLPAKVVVNWKHAELCCMSKLSELGYDIFVPLSSNGEIDCVGFKDGKLYRVQIKCSDVYKDCLQVSLKRNTVNFHRNKSKPYENVDFFLIFDGENVFKVDFDNSFTNITLRYKVPVNGQIDRVRMAKDYLI